MELLLIRHGRPDRIDDDPNGADPGLTELGKRQAAAMADVVGAEPIDAIYVSPQRRARETAEPLAAAFSLRPRIEDGLAEFDVGQTSYVPPDEIAAMDPATTSDWVAGLLAAATDPAFTDRVLKAVGAIIEAHPGQRVAAVCHGGVITTVLNDVLNLPTFVFLESDYASVTRLRASSRSNLRSLVSFNESHWIRGL